MTMDWTTCLLSDWATDAQTWQCIVQHTGRTPISWHPRHWIWQLAGFRDNAHATDVA
jgi:hypothetical protein